MDPDDRTFVRELLLRHEKATDAMIARSDEMIARSNRELDELQRHSEEMRRDHREFMDEQRAGRAALLRMLDRMDGRG